MVQIIDRVVRSHQKFRPEACTEMTKIKINIGSKPKCKEKDDIKKNRPTRNKW